ncbi:hypothetical protein [Klebsiella aerogenes]|uniref:hypothetical protein n=1 Tax=Klebsiella aerogenes TaxID=548 RepID=UPI00254B3D7F|nr:hypothetical protein [Klebsiella aerogenes]MDK7097249.1 hypothetical protein [Klebsiella aerogenes]MDK7642791.1 hypothetical protein [Klebsiella aerogenes]MDK7848170.1 hypothetical protein [Klebsiella aerogenes]MDK8310820.1 hypothetical protein [Klebsiella aerogenes]HEJ0314063.1 hypothetical protein [Klebsiella aerogenes]
MKLTENTQYVTVAEYRSCVTLLRTYSDALYGCCHNDERQSWRARALNQLSKATSFHCHRAKPADFLQFKSACQQLQHSINSVSEEGQLINIT